jgi:hypothetical protein
MTYQEYLFGDEETLIGFMRRDRDARKRSALAFWRKGLIGNRARNNHGRLLPVAAAAPPPSAPPPSAALLLPDLPRSWVVAGGCSLGGLLGPFFGLPVCGLVSCSRVALVRLVGVPGSVRLFPCVGGLGLARSPGCSVPSFLVLPSRVLVPFASCLAGSSFVSPVCAGRVVCWCGSAAPATNIFIMLLIIQ